MYAAAGGASLASRQARKKQQQQQKTNKANQQLLLREKLAQVKASGVSTPTKSRGFHQLPPGYLRPPQGQGRKLSATYTGTHGGSRLLLPITEHHAGASDETRSPHHSSHHHLALGIAHGGQNALHKSATATIPFVSQFGAESGAHALEVSSPPPHSVWFAAGPSDPHHHFPYDGPNLGRYRNQANRLHLPIGADISVTPATPMSPSHFPPSHLTPSQLERKCSVFRGRKLDPTDEHFYRTTTLKSAQDMYNEEFRNYVFPPPMPNGRLAEVDYYCDDPEHRKLGVCTCEVQDLSIAGSSDDEDILGVIRGPSTFANAFLYIGLGTIALGLVIAFVGTGEKGFKTSELRLIGPILIIVGFVFMVLRIFFCICPSSCIRRRDDKKKQALQKADADHRTSLLRNKRVSIARTPMGPNSSHSSKLSRQNTKSIVKHRTYEGVEALRQIATTSLFLQNEDTGKQQSATNAASSLIVPTINEPDQLKEETSLELKRINSIDIDTLNIIDITSPQEELEYVPDASDNDDLESEAEDDDDDSKKLINDDVSSRKSGSVSSIHRQDSHRHSKLSRQRMALNRSASTSSRAEAEQRKGTPPPPLTLPPPPPAHAASGIAETSLMAPTATPPPGTSSAAFKQSLNINNFHQHSLPSTSNGFKFNLLSPPPSRTATSHDHFRFDTPLATLTRPHSAAASSISASAASSSMLLPPMMPQPTSVSNIATTSLQVSPQRLASAPSSAPSATTTATTSYPSDSEIVLSPAKLGQ